MGKQHISGRNTWYWFLIIILSVNAIYCSTFFSIILLLPTLSLQVWMRKLGNRDRIDTLAYSPPFGHTTDFVPRSSGA
jgi:hypothetical protein